MKKSSSDHQAVQTIINTLIVLQSHLKLYGHDNDNVALTSNRISVFLERFFADHDALTLRITRHGFLYDNAFVDRKNVHFQQFAYRMFQHGIAAIALTRGVPTRSLQVLLQLVNRKPAETWDDGGIIASLQARGVTQLKVRELADNDFLLSEAGSADEKDILLGGTSRLWETFAQALLQGLGEAETAPGRGSVPQGLAQTANRKLENSSISQQRNFAHDTSRFLLTLKHENVTLYRNAALERLIAFVEQLSPALRRMFLANAFNLNLSPELAEQFFAGLSDNIILDALQDIADSELYVPPVIVKLLGKLAGNRGLEIAEPSPGNGNDLQVESKRVRDLLKPDDFKKYVPEDYQQTLLNILRSDKLPVESSEKVLQLKRTLEQDMLDDHLGAVLFEILHQEPDPSYVSGLSRHVIEAIGYYLDAGEFRKIILLCRKCLTAAESPQGFPDVVEFLASAPFISGVLDGARQRSKTTTDSLLDLIGLIKKPFIEPILDRLSLEKDRTLRMFYLNSLKRIGVEVVAPATLRLTDERWFVRRNMLYLLREIGDRTVLAEVRTCLRHTHPKVAQEALMTGLTFGDRVAEEHLLALLASEKGSALLKAIMLAGLTKNDRIVDKLLDFLSTSKLLDYQLDIRKVAVRSLTINTPKRAIPVFASILESRSLMHGRESTTLKLEILSALDKFPANEVLPLLDTQVQSKVPEISRQASSMKSRLAGGAS